MDSSFWDEYRAWFQQKLRETITESDDVYYMQYINVHFFDFQDKVAPVCLSVDRGQVEPPHENLWRASITSFFCLGTVFQDTVWLLKILMFELQLLK